MNRLLEFDTVRIISLHGSAESHLWLIHAERLPKIGDEGAILHISPPEDPQGPSTMYIVESNDESNESTRPLWIAEFSRDELEFVSRPGQEVDR